MEFKAKTTAEEDLRLLIAVQKEMQKFADDLTPEAGCMFIAPLPGDVRRAAKDLVAAVLEVLSIEV